MTGAAVIDESRRQLVQPSMDAYADSLALGKDGFNIPSLVGLLHGGPYFHAGNARTLEEAFDATFSAHHQSFAPGLYLIPADVRALVSFLLSIDDATAPVPIPSVELGFDPDLCAQFGEAQ